MLRFSFYIYFRPKNPRSVKSRQRKNKKTKMRQKKAKRFVSILSLAEKDNIIENLEANLLECKKEMSKKKVAAVINRKHNKYINISTHQTSLVAAKTAVATHGKRHYGISKARQTVLASLSGIPTFESTSFQWIETHNDNFGSGQFAELKLVKLKCLDVIAAAKVCNSNNSKKAIEVEAVIGMTVGGHPNFPYVYGLVNERSITMQFFGKYDAGVWTVSPNLAKAVQKLNPVIFKNICKGILQAFIWLHSKKILHNDIKADNIVIHENMPKIIDFGKANMISSCLTYNIEPGTAEHKQYETYHRHLAYELRNTPGSTQSFKTDTYSIGYMFKHTGALIVPSSEHILRLAKMMKHQDPEKRISLLNVLHKLQLW